MNSVVDQHEVRLLDLHTTVRVQYSFINCQVTEVRCSGRKPNCIKISIQMKSEIEVRVSKSKMFVRLCDITTVFKLLKSRDKTRRFVRECAQTWRMIVG